MMFKHLIAVILLSLLLVIGMPYAQQGVQLLLNAHNWVAEFLTQIFSGGEAGNIIRQLLALLSIPVAMGLVPAIIYWLIRRAWFPYFMEVVWVIWLVQFGALAMATKLVAAV